MPDTAMKIIVLTPAVSVTSQMFDGDFAEAARLGFRAIVSNRPDGEEASQPSAAEEAAMARQYGLAFRHVPATKHEMFADAVLDGMADALASLPTPVLVHCASGQRSVIVWAAVSARSLPVDTVLARLREAGFEFEELRELLESQAGVSQGGTMAGQARRA